MIILDSDVIIEIYDKGSSKGKSIFKKLVKAREEDRGLKAEYDHFLNAATLKIDNIKSEIKLEQDNLGVLQVKLSELKQEQLQRKERYQDNKEKLKKQFEMHKKKHVEEIHRIKQKIKTEKD